MRRKGTHSGREYVGRVNYKCVEGASENARSRGTGTGTKQGEEERRRRFWAERVFGGRTRWRWISSVRPHPRRRPFVLPLARRIFIPMRRDGRTGRSSCIPVAVPVGGGTASPASPSFPPFPLQRPILRARANKRDSRPFISLRVNSLNRAGVAQWRRTGRRREGR